MEAAVNGGDGEKKVNGAPKRKRASEEGDAISTCKRRLVDVDSTDSDSCDSLPSAVKLADVLDPSDRSCPSESSDLNHLSDMSLASKADTTSARNESRSCAENHSFDKCFDSSENKVADDFEEPAGSTLALSDSPSFDKCLNSSEAKDDETSNSSADSSRSLNELSERPNAKPEFPFDPPASRQLPCSNSRGNVSESCTEIHPFDRCFVSSKVPGPEPAAESLSSSGKCVNSSYDEESSSVSGPPVESQSGPSESQSSDKRFDSSEAKDMSNANADSSQSLDKLSESSELAKQDLCVSDLSSDEDDLSGSEDRKEPTPCGKRSPSVDNECLNSFQDDASSRISDLGVKCSDDSTAKTGENVNPNVSETRKEETANASATSSDAKIVEEILNLSNSLEVKIEEPLISTYSSTEKIELTLSSTNSFKGKIEETLNLTNSFEAKAEEASSSCGELSEVKTEETLDPSADGSEAKAAGSLLAAAGSLCAADASEAKQAVVDEDPLGKGAELALALFELGSGTLAQAELLAAARHGPKELAPRGDPAGRDGQAEYAQYLGLTPTVKFRCPRCSVATFETLQRLQSHQSRGGCLRAAGVAGAAGAAGTTMRITRKVYLCSSCGTYYEHSQLFLHMRQEHSRHVCLLCLSMFAAADKLAAHLSARHGAGPAPWTPHPCFLECVGCEQLFSDTDDFPRHACHPHDDDAQRNDVASLCHVGMEEAEPCQASEPPPPGTTEPPPAETTEPPPAEMKDSQPSEHKDLQPPETKNQQPSECVESQPTACIEPRPSECMESQPSERREPLSPVSRDSPPSECFDSQPIGSRLQMALEARSPVESPATTVASPVTSTKSPFPNTPLPIPDLKSPATSIPNSPVQSPRYVPYASYPSDLENIADVLGLRMPDQPAPACEDSKPSAEDPARAASPMDVGYREQPCVAPGNEPAASVAAAPARRRPKRTRRRAAPRKRKPPVKPREPEPEAVQLAGREAPLLPLPLATGAPLPALLRACVVAAAPGCVYCNHARCIAACARQLLLHLLAEHRFLPGPGETPPARTDSRSEDLDVDVCLSPANPREEAVAAAETRQGEEDEGALAIREALAMQVSTRLKEALPGADGWHLNADGFDSRDEAAGKPWDGSYECFHCHLQVWQHKELYLHNRKLHQKTCLLCVMCKRNFYSYSELLCHRCPGLYVPGSPTQGFRCPLCCRGDLPSAFRLMVHMRREHHACDVCLVAAGDQPRLQAHVWKHKLAHVCLRCGIAYRNKPDITKHLFWKHGTESVACRRCLQKKWPHVYHFCQPPQQFACEDCTRRFSRAVALRVHRRTHATTPLPYACTQCEERVASRRLLAKHIIKHEAPPPTPPAPEEPPEPPAPLTPPPREASPSPAAASAPSKKSKRSKRPRAPVVDVYDLPPLNLSSDSDSDAGPAPRAEPAPDAGADPAATALPAPPAEEVRGDDGEAVPDAVPSVWDGFREYNARLEARRPPTLAEQLRAALADHDYLAGDAPPGDAPSAVAASAVAASAPLDSDHDYCSPARAAPAAPPSPPPAAPPPAAPAPVAPAAQRKRTSSSSSSSSSSSCSCGPDCSCSSSSSSDSSSDSSTREGRARQEGRRRGRKLRILPVVAPPPDEPAPPPDEAAAAEDELERESDLDTSEPDTDEEFYDTHPALASAAQPPRAVAQPAQHADSPRRDKKRKHRRHGKSDPEPAEGAAPSGAKRRRQPKRFFGDSDEEAPPPSPPPAPTPVARVPPLVIVAAARAASPSDESDEDEPALVIASPSPPPSPPPPAPGPAAAAGGGVGSNLFCYCQCPYDEVSEMIACDGAACRIEWFHFECVGIMVPPQGKWFCPDCRREPGAR